MFSAKRGSLRPNSCLPQAKPARWMFMKSGLRPNIPQVASIQILTISRRRTSSSIVFGWMKERPTRSPELGEAVRGAGEAPVRGHVRDALAVDPDLAAVPERIEELSTRANTHAFSFRSAVGTVAPASAGIRQILP